MRWPGLEVLLPPNPFESEGGLLALPLGAKCKVEVPVQNWPDVDYRQLVQRLRWPVPYLPGRILALCPLCAGVAFYQGAAFTRPDIATGWQSFLLCNMGASRHPMVSTLLANMGVPASLAPTVLVQLRPNEGDAAPDVQEMEVLESFGALWRGPRSSMAQNILSVALPCSHRLYISGWSLAELGVVAFFCEQVNKTAATSRTRVGRYLDDQPARWPRAHVFGVGTRQQSGTFDWLPINSLTSTPEAEMCPFCGASGSLLRSELVTVASWDIEVAASTSLILPGEERQSFHGSLWLCVEQHLWGWRSRRAGIPVTVD